MTRTSITLLASVMLIGFNASAMAADCELPTAPIIPDGNVASQDELVAAQSAYKEFEIKIDEYRGCVEAKEKAVPADAEDAAAQKAAFLALDSASVDVLTKVADEFNVAVRAFKAR